MPFWISSIQRHKAVIARTATCSQAFAGLSQPFLTSTFLSLLFSSLSAWVLTQDSRLHSHTQCSTCVLASPKWSQLSSKDGLVKTNKKKSDPWQFTPATQQPLGFLANGSLAVPRVCTTCLLKLLLFWLPLPLLLVPFKQFAESGCSRETWSTLKLRRSLWWWLCQAPNPPCSCAVLRWSQDLRWTFLAYDLSFLLQALDRERRCELRRHKMDKYSQCPAIGRLESNETWNRMRWLWSLSGYCSYCWLWVYEELTTRFDLEWLEASLTNCTVHG